MKHKHKHRMRSEKQFTTETDLVLQLNMLIVAKSIIYRIATVVDPEIYPFVLILVTVYKNTGLHQV